MLKCIYIYTYTHIYIYIYAIIVDIFGIRALSTLKGTLMQV